MVLQLKEDLSNWRTLVVTGFNGIEMHIFYPTRTLEHKPKTSSSARHLPPLGPEGECLCGCDRQDVFTFNVTPSGRVLKSNFNNIQVLPDLLYCLGNQMHKLDLTSPSASLLQFFLTQSPSWSQTQLTPLILWSWEPSQVLVFNLWLGTNFWAIGGYLLHIFPEILKFT